MTARIRFFNSLLLFSALVFLTGVILFSTFLSDYFLPIFYLFIFYFFLLTIAGRLFVVQSNPEKPGDFNTRYFIVRWAKVLLHLIFIVVYITNDRENILPFIMVFLACYVLFSVFDIYTLSFSMKKK